MSKLLRLGQTAKVGQTFAVEGDVARHVAALRLTTVGATFDVVDADGRALAALVTMVDPLTIKVVGLADAPNREPSVEITAWVPVLKGGRTEDLLRQLTELGVGALVLFTSSHSVARLTPAKAAKKCERWTSVVASATEQCGRVAIPTVRFHAGIPTSDAASGVFLTVMERPSVREVFSTASSPLSILVGPEGGLSTQEIERLEHSGWRGAWLGHRILRAETACIAATTLALHALGEGGY